jgi:hypothetical protein
MTFEWVFTVLAHSFSFTNPNNSTGKPHSIWRCITLNPVWLRYKKQ